MMRVFTSFPASLPRTALTLGSFDGVHLGHQALFKALKKTNAPTTVITFTNSPLQILQPNFQFSGFLCSLEERLSRIEKAGIDFVIALPFTQEIAQMPYDQFLSSFSLSHLILGEGAAFGWEKQGTVETITSYAKEHDFEVHYLPKLRIENSPVSSRRIRQAILESDFALASRLLGRPFSISFPAHSLEIKNTTLCLPPDGTYPVWADQEELLVQIETSSEGRTLSLTTSFKQVTPLTFVNPRGFS